MSQSHQRSTRPGAAHNRTPDVVGHALKGKYYVLDMAPQYPYGPSFAACCEAESMALFFDPDAAQQYCDWKNGRAFNL